jgi:hypothetical protein
MISYVTAIALLRDLEICAMILLLRALARHGSSHLLFLLGVSQFKGSLLFRQVVIC